MKFAIKQLCLLLAVVMLLTTVACGKKENNDAVPPASSSDAASSYVTTPNGTVISSDEVVATMWDGTVANSVAKGGGTEEYPYLVTTGAELAYAVTKGEGEYYQLQNDIYLNDVSDANWMTKSDNNKWVTTESNTYLHLDGNGYCVYGIWNDSSNPSGNSGLVCNISGGYVKNLGIRYSFIVAKNYAGAITGRASGEKSTVIEKCFADETVYVQYIADGNNGAGGLIGYTSGNNGNTTPSVQITDCYSKAKVAGKIAERVNGIIGTSWEGAYKIKNCYSVGYAPYWASYASQASYLLKKGVAKNDVSSGIYTDLRSAANLENYTKLDLSSMKGSSAKKSLSGFDFDNVWQTVDGGTPKLKIFADINGKDISGLPQMSDLQKVTSDFASGKGTKNDPYIVADAAQLRLVVKKAWKDVYFKLSNDIYINNSIKTDWKSSATVWETSSEGFSGHFDGNGKTVYGLYSKDTLAQGAIVNGGVGLFPTATISAEIKNVNIKGASLSGKAYVGAIVGQLIDGGKDVNKYLTISGCTVDDSVSLTGQTVGGIVGGGYGGVDISYCGFYGDISNTGGAERGNGIVGDIWHNNYMLNNCYAINYKIYRNGYTPKTISAVYSTETQNGVTTVSYVSCIGSDAKTAMSDFDWNRWKTVDGSFPTLK